MFFKNKKPAPYKPTAWECAVFEVPPTKPVPQTHLRKITGDLAQNDIRVVLESTNLVLTTKNADTRERRRAVAKERYAHLETLKPFMDKAQLATCVPADEAMVKLLSC